MFIFCLNQLLFDFMSSIFNNHITFRNLRASLIQWRSFWKHQFKFARVPFEPSNVMWQFCPPIPYPPPGLEFFLFLLKPCSDGEKDEIPKFLFHIRYLHWIFILPSPLFLQIYDNFRLSHFLDASDDNASSWMRFIQCARHTTEQNLFVFQYYGSIYYRCV